MQTITEQQTKEALAAFTDAVTKVGEYANTASLGALQHFYDHGNFKYLQEFLDTSAVHKRRSRHDAFKEWLLKFSPLNARTERGKLILYKDPVKTKKLWGEEKAEGKTEKAQKLLEKAAQKKYWQDKDTPKPKAKQYDQTVKVENDFTKLWNKMAENAVGEDVKLRLLEIAELLKIEDAEATLGLEGTPPAERVGPASSPAEPQHINH